MIKLLLKYRFLVWFIITALQATFTDIFHDEAYYWLWSKHLAWGYFDHPPMIAWIIKVGTLWGDQEIFVRSVIVCMNVGFIYLLEKIIHPDNLLLFWKILLSLVVLQLGGFIAVPDLPLLFFAMIYYFVLQKYLETDSWRYSLLLALSAAGMLYSKYHGVLVITFSLIAHPYLLKRKTFYFFALIGILLYLPHLYWQYTHDWVSLHYHFVERSVGENFKIENTLDYIGTQLLFTGPLIGWLLVFCLFKSRSQNKFEKSLRYSGIGILGFFLLMSIKGRVESNWTNVAFIPLIYFGYKEINKDRKWLRFTHIIFCISFPLILLLRIFMVYNFLPRQIHFETDFHNWKTWAKQMEAKANGLPIAFINSYQKAAKYTYYTGKEAVCLTDLTGRHNQYDLWKADQKLYGKSALVVLNWRDSNRDSAVTVNRTWTTEVQSPFITFSPIQVIPVQNQFTTHANDTINIPFSLLHTFDRLPDLTLDKFKLPRITCQFYDAKKQLGESATSFFITNESFDRQEHVLKMAVPNLDKGKHQFRLSITSGDYPTFLNSNRISLIVN